MENDLSEPIVDDPRDSSTAHLDDLTNKVNELVCVMHEHMQAQANRETHNQVQTVIHKTEGMGAWGVAAVTACFFSFFGLILFAIFGSRELERQDAVLHDLQAYTVSHQSKISALESAVKKKE